jgi:hypothetical protein
MGATGFGPSGMVIVNALICDVDRSQVEVEGDTTQDAVTEVGFVQDTEALSTVPDNTIVPAGKDTLHAFQIAMLPNVNTPKRIHTDTEHPAFPGNS